MDEDLLYDPDTEPDPGAWLALDEGEQLSLVLEFHEEARVRLPNDILHATIHVIVENQAAEGSSPVRETLRRLQAEGLCRHDAVHAVGSVLNELMTEVMNAPPAGDPNLTYAVRLKELTAKGWLDSF